MMPSLLAISFMVGLAYVTRYSGMDTVLGLSLTGTGWLFPFFGTLLGWLGVALTGTDAGSNALFGNLQKVTAEQLGLSPILMGAANTTGGVMGKMIDAQSIVVSSSATHQQGNEAAIFKAVFWHSIVLASLVGLIVMFYAYVVPSLIPGAGQLASDALTGAAVARCNNRFVRDAPGPLPQQLKQLDAGESALLRCGPPAVHYTQPALRTRAPAGSKDAR